MREGILAPAAILARAALLVVVGLMHGCRDDGAAVTVYCSMDETFAREVLNAFEKRTGLATRVLFDSEAGKTTGLVQRLVAERDRPRADVFFSGELFNTILLGDQGLLASWDWPGAADIPPAYRDKGRRWTAIGLRARVLAYDPARTQEPELPAQWEQLADPRWASRLAVANPLFGTTRGHVAAMYALWGEPRCRAFLTALRDAETLVVDGNSAAVRAVLDGRASWCMTDSDDVWVAQRDGASIALTYPAMVAAAATGGGTLWIPSSVAVIDAGPNRAGAEALADFLVSAEAERLLARSAARNLPVRPALRESLGLATPAMADLDYRAVAAAIEPSARLVRELLIK